MEDLSPTIAVDDVAADPSSVAQGIDNVTLARLLDEVRSTDVPHPTAYNRQHNRHNRS